VTAVRRPRFLVASHGKSALTRIKQTTSAVVKATITDTFANLANFVTLSGTPSITAGRLSGSAFAVRHRDQCGTDNYMVKAVIGARNVGRSWLVTCASESFDRFYALEVQTFVSGGRLSIIKGTGVKQTASSGLLGILLGLVQIFLEVLSDLFTALTRWVGANVSIDVGNEVAVWFDEDNHVIRGYRNGVQITSLAVKPWELPHGDGFRHFGVVTSPDALGGVEFTSIEAADV
jgi:hypothetical protein